MLYIYNIVHRSAKRFTRMKEISSLCITGGFDMANLERIKDIIYDGDNKACFIERDRILSRLSEEYKDYTAPDKYARILATLLSEVSCPIEDCDYFAGRVVEARPDEGLAAPNTLLNTLGHMSYHYEKLLSIGMKGILAEIKAAACRKEDEESLSFAKNAEIVTEAVRDYAKRYAAEARKQGKTLMADALEKVPYEPAYDFFSALQSVWLIHMIASCYVGSRDYAFGRFDQYMLPYYEKALADGMSREDAVELLAGFLIKTNEICGRCTHNYDTKPILCQASKQYVNIGGECPNAFSSVVLDAAILSNMAQPQIIVLLKPDADEDFTSHVFEALAKLHDKMNIYNYDLLKQGLLDRGIEESVASDFTYSACCTFDLHYHTIRMEYYVPVPQIFRQVLVSGDYSSVKELLSAFRKALRINLQAHVDAVQQGHGEEACRCLFVLDSIFTSDSAAECRYPGDGRAKYNMINLFCPGIATIGDSLMALDKLVFGEKRYSYADFIAILERDFEGEETLREEILSYVKFGNDSNADAYTVMAGNAFADAVEELKLKPNFYTAPGFYSLERENSWCHQLGATPDGRKAGTPFSENQSPTYGADREGITALLKSVAKLPFNRTLSGGLNLTFSRQLDAKILASLIRSYFEMGGIHAGISIIHRETLEDAMVNPARYRSLTVRLYGFSEYFTSLPEWQQKAVLNRTEYAI